MNTVVETNAAAASKLVAVVVPIYRTELDVTERIALRVLERHLGQYDRFVVHPLGLKVPVEMEGLVPVPMSPRRFRDIGAYSAMLMSPAFYRRFSDYRYILVYQTDCLVFRDELMEWCNKGYSYIGSPWLKKDRDKKRRHYLAVGNGGLSLRHVGDHLRVLQSAQLRLTAMPGQSQRFFRTWRQGRRLLGFWLRCRLHAGKKPAVHTLRRYFNQAEDMFWAYYAALLDPDYTIAPIEVAMGFARERSAEGGFPVNADELPFGAHAWDKIDTERWLPFLDAEDADLLRATRQEEVIA